MAPKRGESIERSDEREAFMKKLADYHEERGYVVMCISRAFASSADPSSPLARTLKKSPKSVSDMSISTSSTVALWAKADTIWCRTQKRSR